MTTTPAPGAPGVLGALDALAAAVGDGPPLLLRAARLADGSLVDIEIGLDGRIADVTPAGSLPPAPGVPVLDLGGRLVLPAAVEPHAHLDKALTADDSPNRTGDLMGAVEAWHARWPRLTVEDMVERASEAVRRSVANGITSIRTHADLGPGVGLRAVEALCTVRDRFAGVVPIQVTALVTIPTSGDDGAPNRALLRQAAAHGIDVVGGCPHLDPDPQACIDACLEVAGEHGLPLDLHVDETLDASMLSLAVLARRVLATGFDRGATASHCVSLGMQPAQVQAEVAALVAEAGVAVVTLPQTNLFLQAREIATAPPRGLTAIAALRAAGAVVAAGADNLQDPFNTVGRADPFETAALLVMAGHLSAEDAWSLVTAGSRAALGLPAPAIAPGAPGDLLAVPSPTLRAAIADAPGDRIVVGGGRFVARTTAAADVIAPA